jgi:hypothetical protein
VRSGDIAPLVVLVISFPPLAWLAYQLIRRPATFPDVMLRALDRFWSKVIPGFDNEMYARAIPLPWAKSRAKLHYDGTTGSPEKDAKIRRFDRIYFRVFGFFLAFFSVIMLFVIIAIATGNAHAQ